jgi:hypothetical protein
MKILHLSSTLLAFVVLTLFSAGAHATVVNTLLRDTDPANTDILCRTKDLSSSLVQNCWTDGVAGPGSDVILDHFETIVPGFDSDDLLYKAEYGNDPVDEEGSLAGSYSTTFEEVGGDIENATITYDGGASVDCSNIADPCFLLIKGGEDPYAYLFNLALGWDPDPRYEDGSSIGGDGYGWSSNALGIPSWNGLMDLEMLNFGDFQLGSISHVALYGNSVSPVPVPAAFWLFGTALLGFIGLARKTSV